MIPYQIVCSLGMTPTTRHLWIVEDIQCPVSLSADGNMVRFGSPWINDNAIDSRMILVARSEK